MTSRQKTYGLIVLILLVYFFLRTVHLGLLPINNDESTYIRFGMHQLKEPDHQPYSLLIGKEPLMPFLYAFFGTTFGNLLLGARWVTILVGVLNLLGLYLFTKKVTGKLAAFFAVGFYVVAPFTVFFDRLALLDSPVSTVAIWSLYFTHVLLQKSLWKYAITLGTIMGIGLWIKTTDVFYIFLPFISYGIFYFTRGDKEFTKGKMFISALLITLIMYLPLYSNQYYAVHLQLLKQYTYPVFSVFLFPIGNWWNNLLDIIEWLFFYLTPPMFLLAVGMLIVCTKQKKYWLVLLWFYLPCIYEILYDKLFASRHVLLLTIPLFVLAGYGMSLLWKKKRIYAVVLSVIILVWSLFYDVMMITSPQQYQSLFVDRALGDVSGYSHGWSSGYGIQEAVDYLKKQAANQQIVVVIRNDHGNPEDAIVAYLNYEPNIFVVLMNDPVADVKGIFQKVPPTTPVYFVSRGINYVSLDHYFASEIKYKIPQDTGFVGVIRLKQLVSSGWSTYTNPKVKLVFDYPKQLHIKQINNSLIELMENPSSTDLSTMVVFYVTQVPAANNSINISLPIKIGNLVNVKPATYNGFMAATATYSSGKQILYLKHDSELIAVYLPTSTSIPKADYDKILQSIRTN